MIDVLLDPFRESTNLRALLEVAFVGAAGGAVGCWVLLYRLSYSAESLAHGLLPGLVIAALTGTSLLLGAAAGVVVAALAVALAGRVPAIGHDTAVAVVVTTLFGLGALLALSPETPAHLQDLLFGEVLGASTSDIVAAAILALVATAALVLLAPLLTVVGFDRVTAPALGRPPLAADIALGLLIAAVLLIAVRGLGNLLVVALLVAPAATARLVTHRLPAMMMTAAGVAVVAGAVGLAASYHLRVAAGAAVALALVAAYVVAAGCTRRLA